MTDSNTLSVPRLRRSWLYLAAAGVILVVLALAVVALVLVDKNHFGGLVGSAFLGSVTGAVIVGGLVLAVATWKLPLRRTWRGAVLFVWALIAVTSPLFGIMFLLPWSVLALSLPLVIAILYTQFRRSSVGT